MNASSELKSLGRMYGGKSTQDRIQERRDRFLDAGLQLFGTVGYKATTVRALCRQAQLTDRYFYESFDSVERLLIDVYRRQNQRLADRMGAVMVQAAQQSSVGDVARQVLRSLFEYAQDPVVARMVWKEVLGVSPEVDAVYQKSMNDFGELFLTWVRLVFPHWSGTPQREHALAMAVVGAVSHSVMTWLLEGFVTPIDDLVQANAAVIEGLALFLSQNPGPSTV